MKAVQFIQKYSTGKFVSVLFFLTMFIYFSMLFYYLPVVMAFAPDLPIFDLSPAGYSFSVLLIVGFAA